MCQDIMDIKIKFIMKEPLKFVSPDMRVIIGAL